MEESSITHFSHEHKLSLFQADFEDPKPHLCHICALPILSAPSYTCNIHPNNCNNFFVHKACTQLPQTYYHHLHLKTLHLTKPARVGGSFTYEFENSRGLDLHPLVAQPVEILSRHRSHNIAHPLALLCREISCRCDVCGKEEKGFFFNCKECGLFIHQDCTVLPSVMRIPSHSHPFILAYSLPYVPSRGRKSDYYKCTICDGDWLPPDGGVYFCGECYALAHVACAKPDMTNVISDTEFVHLPKEEDTMVIRSFVEKKNLQNPASSSSSCSQLIENEDKHPLILEDACTSRDDNDAVCDVCIQPIINTASSSYYRCGDCSHEFVAHPFCAPHLLPPRFQQVFGPVSWELLLRGHDELAKSFFNSVFCCCECNRLSNGFSYSTGLMYDVECAGAPKTIKHASHKQHILFQTGNRWFSDANCKISCCNTTDYGGIYRCVVCEYSIHNRCALLPKTTRHHKFDDHPLHLIMNTPPPPNKDYFCEVCEQQMDHQLKDWYYACPKCDQYFHVNCIPSVGLMSKIKFGKTLDVDHKLHEHPLTLTRMLTHQRNETCGHCKRIIKGFSDDEMALHCSPCHFWLHFFCAAAAENWPPNRCNKEDLQYDSDDS